MKLFLRNYLLVMLISLSFLAGCSQPTGQANNTAPAEVAQPSQISEVAAPEITVEPVTKELNSDASQGQSEQAAVDNSSALGGILKVDKENYDFGNIEPGGLTHGSYILTNAGQGTLEIERVTAPCRCTVPELPKKVLEPGESVELKFTFNVGNTSGKVIKKINLTTKSPSKPESMTLTFTADIRKVLDVAPTNLTFGLKSDYDNKQELVINSTDESEFRITGFICNGDAATVVYDPAVSAKSHRLVVEGNIDNLRNAPTGLITIKTDNPKVDRLSVRYDTKMPFDAFPKTKRFTPETQAGRQAKIKVVSNFKEEFELGDISSKAGYIKVLDTRKSVDGYEVTIELDMTRIQEQEKEKKYISDYLLIPIVGHDQDTLEVHCYGLVR